MTDPWGAIIAKTLKYEGGFQSVANDRGNWTGGAVGKGILRGTNFGISAMSYPLLDIKNLTREEAVAIYSRDFYAPLYPSLYSGCPALCWKIFDIGVNTGKSRPVRWIQQWLQVPTTGAMGSATQEAVRRYLLRPGGPDGMLIFLSDQQVELYDYIIANRPQMAKWATGWYRRALDTAAP